MTVSRLDKARQANFHATDHIDPKTSKAEIARFVEFIQVLDIRGCPVLEFS